MAATEYGGYWIETFETAGKWRASIRRTDGLEIRVGTGRYKSFRTGEFATEREAGGTRTQTYRHWRDSLRPRDFLGVGAAVLAPASNSTNVLIAAAPLVIIGALILLVLDMPVADELPIEVTFDPGRGYVATHPQLAAPVIALSLTVLRARLASQLGGVERVHLKLDRLARAQRDKRRRGGAARASDTMPV